MALAVDPAAQIVVSVLVDVSSVAVVEIVLELPLVDDVVYFFADAMHTAVRADLADDVFVEVTLAKLHVLIDRLIRVVNDLFEPKRTQLVPPFFHLWQGFTSLFRSLRCFDTS